MTAIVEGQSVTNAGHPVTEPMPRPVTEPMARPVTEPMARGMRTTIGIFVAVPLIAVVLAVPVAWGGWLGWTDLILAGLFYVVAAAGITVGFHRHFTHGSFKAPTWVSVVLAIAGSTAIEGSLDQWVADHRRHHARSD